MWNAKVAKPFGVRMLLVIMSLLGMVGCQSRSSTSEHLGEEAHDLPAHRPVSFAAAVEDLPRRLAMLEATSNSEHSARLEQLHELEDILRWLPELASDSDLRKSDWEKATKASSELEDLLRPWLLQVSEKPVPHPDCSAILERLKHLAKKSQESQEAV